MNFYALPTGITIGPITISFYALCILAGALASLFISMKYLSKRGYSARLLENVFYIAFPMGIVGARLWYVIVEWNKTFAADPIKMFAIWEGGLAIQGGVVLGAAAGIWFMKKYRSYVPILVAVDVIVPTILVAQAIGRWGNFFNQEVFGSCVNRSDWAFLPGFILDQMEVSACSASGQIAVPLFLIESIVNIIGFLLIYFFVRKVLKKIIVPGDLMGCYFVWYGTVRAILEPLRNPEYIMGDKVMASRITSIVFIIVGVLIIVGAHIFDKYYTKKKALEIEDNFNHYLDVMKR